MADEELVPAAGYTLGYARGDDAAELLVLQRCCWVTEAILNDTFAIPALHEDLEAVEAWVESTHVWTLRKGPRLIAAVRAHQEGQRWEIGRLMVAPDLRGTGLGRWLLSYAESQAPDSVHQFDLFTGRCSERNVKMYRSAGYELTEPASGQLGQHISGAVYLSKPRVGTSRL
ncbi:GNAT family N-acetyltransferase [Cellulomonas sp. PhB143]|uniref:GNAT family N-acetyltransferase n=1 Tax=Cellulomonas sp. PhB143 TaxID=2485186 RepID=UPI000F49D901|nr:GNAT family N-acetyltransferase [Cellulomonas sp. PhB143]ROS75516.1 acetyltransferase (GNAT) family protein [Cellulomonas sp. PhB143]